MGAGHGFLQSLAVVLCVAAVTTVLFQRLRQPVVLGYLLAGLIIGPHVPIPLVADLRVTQELAELGVILLMFSLGLEFSLRKLGRVGPSAGLAAVLEVSAMAAMGFAAGRALGWTQRESLYAGAMVSISSTTIIAKAFEERRVSGRLRDLVFSLLVVEDLVAILALAAFTAASSGRRVSAAMLGLTAGRLALFLVAILVAGMLLVPRAVRAVVALRRPETTLVASIGICFAMALLAQAFGYSVALGAFLAGSLVAESGEAETVGELVRPVRDVFAAVFFVAVGMQIDPSLVVRHAGAIAALTAVVVLGKIASVAVGAFLGGNGVRTSVQAGMSLAQIGEFSFLIAGVGVTLGATGEFLRPVAVAVSAITTLLTPWLIRAAGPVASYVDRKLPAPLQTFAALYGRWVEQLRTAAPTASATAAHRRLARLLALDAAALVALAVGASRYTGDLAALASRRTRLDGDVTRAAVVGAALAVAAPFGLSIVRVAQRLGAALAERAMPPAEPGALDLAAAPRRSLALALQLACVSVVFVPLIAVTEAFVPPWLSGSALAALLVVLGVMFWKSATNLEGHVRASVQVIAEALAAQSREAPPHEAPRRVDIAEVLPGLGSLTPVKLRPESRAVGRTLGQMNLRGRTGATALAILRGGSEGHTPGAHEALEADDVLVLTGSEASIARAARLLEAVDDTRAARGALEPPRA